MFEMRAPRRKEIARRMENFRLNGGDVLDLSHLYMTELPLEIKSMENLAVLDLSYNQLKTLPDWIGDLRQNNRPA